MSAVVRLDPSALALPAPAVSAGALEVATISELAAFTAMREEWNQLLESSRAATVFLSWEWLHTWWTHAPVAGRVAILAVRRGALLVGLAPFRSRRDLCGAERFEFLGTGRVGSDYLDVIAREGDEAAVVAALASHVTRNGAILDLKQVRVTTSSAAGLARELVPSRYVVRVARTHRCPYIDLAGLTWDGYLASLGSEHRYNFRRKLRKLEAKHTLRIESATSEASRRALLPVLFDLHQRRWSERGGSDGLAGLEAFHEHFSQLALERGWLRLFVLRLDEIPAAVLYGFRYGRVFSFYQSGFDPSFRNASVGLVALGIAIRGAIEEEAGEFDLLHGQEPYKFHWASRSRRLGRIAAYPNGAAGRLALGQATAVEAARRVLRMLPAGVAASFAAIRGGMIDAAPAG